MRLVTHAKRNVLARDGEACNHPTRQRQAQEDVAALHLSWARPEFAQRFGNADERHCTCGVDQCPEEPGLKAASGERHGPMAHKYPSRMRPAAFSPAGWPLHPVSVVRAANGMVVYQVGTRTLILNVNSYILTFLTLRKFTN